MKAPKLHLYLLLFSTLSAANFGYANAAETDEARAEGLRIAQEVKQQDLGWGDSQADLTMVLANKRGEKSSLELTFKSLEVLDDGDKSLMVFNYPLDVKGTALLSFTHVLQADDKWLFLPALKRIKKITSQAKSGSFMGSEFAYEDLSSFELGKYDYRYLGQETLDEREMYVVEFIPQDEFSGYKFLKTWIDIERYTVDKIEYYDRKSELLKTEHSSDYKRYLDRYWRAHKIHVLNNQTGKNTTLITDTLKFKNGLKESDFNRATLRRTR